MHIVFRLSLGLSLGLGICLGSGSGSGSGLGLVLVLELGLGLGLGFSPGGPWSWLVPVCCRDQVDDFESGPFSPSPVRSPRRGSPNSWHVDAAAEEAQAAKRREMFGDPYEFAAEVW